MRKRWLKRFVALVTSLVVLAWSTPAFADVDEVNTSPANKCQVLGGKPGVAFSLESARRLRDAAEILLPGCQREKALVEERGEIRLLRINTLTEIRDDLKDSLAGRKEEAKELRKIKTGITSSPTFWFVIGVIAGAGTAVGVGYAIAGAR